LGLLRFDEVFKCPRDRIFCVRIRVVVACARAGILLSVSTEIAPYSESFHGVQPGTVSVAEAVKCGGRFSLKARTPSLPSPMLV
jgi:hypothetical protein